MTAAGQIRLQRLSFRCIRCGDTRHALDQRIGIDGYLSGQARRLFCLAGSACSFDAAKELLLQACGLTTTDETIRRCCLHEAGQMSAWQMKAEEATASFQAADGDLEFQTDAAKVNTTESWRDMKIGIFAKRDRGEAAEAKDWATRSLPVPNARFAFAAVEPIEEFGRRWGPLAARLGIEDPSRLTVLGDGAEWIWNAAARELPEAKGLLDIFHGVEHVSAAAQQTWGEGSSTATAWTESVRQSLLSDGWYGLCEQMGQTLAACAAPADRSALDGLMTYFAKHTERLNYALRLRTGQSIGSGMVEGAAKNMIGRRLKQTGARWTVTNVNRMAEMCSLIYSGNWDSYWTHN